MKIWVTRSSGSSLWSGGLERCFVWFRKPVWTVVFRSAQDDDNPFGILSDKNGRMSQGWEVREGNTTWISQSVSFGKLFGYGDREDEYENEIAEYVWNELIEHFNKKSFGEEWDESDRQGITHIKDFILEIDIKVQFNKT